MDPNCACIPALFKHRQRPRDCGLNDEAGAGATGPQASLRRSVVGHSGPIVSMLPACRDKRSQKQLNTQAGLHLGYRATTCFIICIADIEGSLQLKQKIQYRHVIQYQRVLGEQAGLSTVGLSTALPASNRRQAVGERAGLHVRMQDVSEDWRQAEADKKVCAALTSLATCTLCGSMRIPSVPTLLDACPPMHLACPHASQLFI